MKRFKTVLPALHAASRQLPMAPAPCLPSEIPAWLDAIPFRLLRKADDACRAFAATLAWPDVDPELLAQLHLRVQQATQFATALQDQPIPREQGSETLEFLLIDLWYNSAHRWATECFQQTV